MALFGVNPGVNIGLAGNPAQSLTPAALTYHAVAGFWKAEGIPIVPHDDAGIQNTYPMVKVVARAVDGTVLATTYIVLPVSEEMTCVRCHSSGTGDPAAQPVAGWVNDPVPEIDYRKNILRLHDERNLGKAIYTAAITRRGYNPAGLYTMAISGAPILCAGCHASNALGTPGATGINQLTNSIHSWHGPRAIDDTTGLPLDNALSRTACYYCHPGGVTQCLRGVMGNARDASGNMVIQCQNCHGNVSKVGAATRAGWIDLPSCQTCHYVSPVTGAYVRDLTVFDASGNFRVTTGAFGSGASLFKVGAGHGGIQCEACHGATHAEYGTSQPNDNIQSMASQGYAGKITECGFCHRNIPLTGNLRPHGLHTIGQTWVTGHGGYAQANKASCTTCHGADFRGTFLSAVPMARVFNAEGRQVNMPQGHAVSCYDCHTTI
jgi:hypothetical protein